MLTVEEEEAKLRGGSPIEVVEVGRLPPLLDYHPLISGLEATISCPSDNVFVIVIVGSQDQKLR